MFHSVFARETPIRSGGEAAVGLLRVLYLRAIFRLLRIGHLGHRRESALPPYAKEGLQPEYGLSESIAPAPVESGAPLWTRVKGSHLVEQIIEQVRGRIYTSLAPGEWIGTEVNLAETFGVSRPVMHDAVRALRTIGLVEVRVGPGGGLRVAHSDPRRLAEALAVQLHQLNLDWKDVSDALITIEPGLAGLAARRRSDDDLDRLRSIIEQHHATIEDRLAFFTSAGAFHAAIASAAANPALVLAIKALRLNLDRVAVPITGVTHNRSQMIRDHQAILEAIEARDAERATHLMEEHDQQIMANRRPRPAALDPLV